MGIAVPLVLIFFTCLLIWRACDGFEIASEYLGRNMSEGVRGGTINAISSSIPELFTTLIALFILDDQDGFSIGLGTTAGSALFNGMIIPAACILAVVGTVVSGIRVSAVQVSRKVILRDGLTLIACQLVLVVLINGRYLYWWQGMVLMLMYLAYLAFMLLSMKTRMDEEIDNAGSAESGGKESASGLPAKLFYWLSGGPILDLQGWFIHDHQEQQIESKSWNAWPLLITATAVIGAACWLLVTACEWLGTGPGNSLHQSYQFFGYQLHGLGMPAMFVAVIFASMATSVPDTVISIRDARDGDYDDAVANAIGSNIFDICFALGFPLMLFTLIHGPLKMDAEIALQSGEIRLLLLALTVVGFFVYYLGKQQASAGGGAVIEMKRGKAVLLLLIYLLFVLFIIGRSQDQSWANTVSQWLQRILAQLPSLD